MREPVIAPCSAKRSCAAEQPLVSVTKRLIAGVERTIFTLDREVKSSLVMSLATPSGGKNDGAADQHGQRESPQAHAGADRQMQDQRLEEHQRAQDGYPDQDAKRQLPEQP